MKQEQATGAEPGKRRTRVFSAKEKAEAVLSLWSGRRTTSALIKELQVPWAILNTWEKRALNGMLTALDPSWKQAEQEPPSLPERVEKLIEKTLKPTPAPAAAN